MSGWTDAERLAFRPNRDTCPSCSHDHRGSFEVARLIRTAEGWTYMCDWCGEPYAIG